MTLLFGATNHSSGIVLDFLEPALKLISDSTEKSITIAKAWCHQWYNGTFGCTSIEKFSYFFNVSKVVNCRLGNFWYICEDIFMFGSKTATNLPTVSLRTGTIMLHTHTHTHTHTQGVPKKMQSSSFLSIFSKQIK